MIAEYALQDINKSIGVSTYQVRQELPKYLQESLPSIEQLEAQLDAVFEKAEQEDESLIQQV